MKQLLIDNAGYLWAVRSTFSALFRVFSRLTRKPRSRRFLLLSPPCLRKQVIFDRINRQLFAVNIESRTDLGTLRQIFQDEDYGLSKLQRDAELRDTYREIVSSGSTPLIVDCGANIGLSAHYFAREYPDARIVCVEPDSKNIACAKNNNRSKNISFYHGAIGSENGRSKIANADDINNAYQTELTPDGDIPVYTVSQIMTEESQRAAIIPFMIKIDIEGFEDELFSKNTSWVESFPLLVIELHDWMLPRSANSYNFLKTISSKNRDFVYFGENIFSIQNKPEQEK
jgi:FkbM family methyltransferase